MRLVFFFDFLQGKRRNKDLMVAASTANINFEGRNRQKPADVREKLHAHSALTFGGVDFCSATFGTFLSEFHAPKYLRINLL